MMKFYKSLRPIGVLLATFLLAYCSSYSYLPTSADVERAKIKWPEVDSTELLNSYSIYKNKCGSCHFLYRPEQYSEQQWELILPKMKPVAKLTDKEIDMIRKYIYTHNGKKDF